MEADFSHTIIVAGGGMAGIAAASALAAAGVRPVLIESRPYLGGRTRSFVHEGTGDEIDNGQHLLMGCYHSTLKLLEMLGTQHLVELQQQLTVEFRDADGRQDVLRAGTLPPPLNVLTGLLRLKHLSKRERLSLLRIGMDIRFGRGRMDETVRKYLTRLGQSPTVQTRLWDPMVIATLNTPPERASAYLFREVLRRAFLGTSRSDSQLGFVRGGLSQLLAPAESYIASRGEVLIGATITGIRSDDNGFTLTVKDRPPLHAQALISALPHRNLSSVFEGDLLPKSPVAPFTSSPIVSVYLWYNQSLTDIPVLSALLGTRTQWVFNRRKMDPRENRHYPGLLTCTVSAAFEETATDSKEVIAMTDRELRGAFPELRGAKLLDALVIKEKHATFAAEPEVEPLRSVTRSATAGLFLAGDWTATSLPATIEGAVQSGFAAAEEALLYLHPQS